jgi:hypothetical protein
MQCNLKKIHEPGDRGLNRSVWEVLRNNIIVGHIEIDFSDHEPWRPLIVRAIHTVGKFVFCSNLKEAQETFNLPNQSKENKCQ